MSTRIEATDGRRSLHLEAAGSGEVTLTLSGATATRATFSVAELEAALAHFRRQQREPSYSLGRDMYADRADPTCSSCSPGRPCYGHGH